MTQVSSTAFLQPFYMQRDRKFQTELEYLQMDRNVRIKY